MFTPEATRARASAFAAEAQRKLLSPETVVRSATMTTDEKRALLASWASDARAVQNHPALRRLDDGAVVEIDSILDALRQLDGLPVFAASTGHGSSRSYPKASRPGLGQRWQRGGGEDDDGPISPAPAAPHPSLHTLTDGVAAAA